MALVRVIRIDDWTHTHMLATRLIGFSFRGQARHNWLLNTSLERAVHRWQGNFATMRRCEEEILYEFRRRAHHYLSDPPGPAEDLEWLALVQHFGGSTRLLDITRSFHVAAFFATEYADDTAAVWCVNRTHLWRYLTNKLGLPEPFNRIPFDQACRELSARIIRGEALQRGVVPVEPYRLNRRISVQQGGFLLPMATECSFLANLSESLGVDIESALDAAATERYDGSMLMASQLSDAGLIKILFPRHTHSSTILNLEQMNVSAASLFEGLDGFARSLTAPMRVTDRFHSELEHIARTVVFP